VISVNYTLQIVQIIERKIFKD